MNDIVTEYDTEVLLTRLAREAHAKKILSTTPSLLPYALTAILGVGIYSFLVFSSKFNAPIVIHVILGIGFLGAILNALENFVIRRKLEAAIELIQIQKSQNASPPDER